MFVALELCSVTCHALNAMLAAGIDAAVAMLLLWLADRSQAPEAARSPPAGRNLHRLGWLGSGAAFFWIVLISIQTLAA